MKNKHVIIYGGSSLISKEVLKILLNEFNHFSIFCRNKNSVEKYINEIKIENTKIDIYEADLIDLEKNLSIVDKLKNDLSGLIWIAGSTGNPDEEFQDKKKCEENIKINFTNPVIIINKIIPKIIEENDSFVLAVASVAGLRGRSKRLFYSSAKSGLISYLSGLRQKLFEKKINVITVIPGYIKTKPFNIKAPSFLISSPEQAAKSIYKAIKLKKNIIYINSFWWIIMLFVRIIPEKIYRKLKF